MKRNSIFYLNNISDNIFNCYHPEYIEDSDHFVEEWLPKILTDSETRHVNESELVEGNIGHLSR